jgi:hypothetical protein
VKLPENKAIVIRLSADRREQTGGAEPLAPGLANLLSANRSVAKFPALATQENKRPACPSLPKLVFFIMVRQKRCA